MKKSFSSDIPISSRMESKSSLSSEEEDTEKEHMISLRGFNFSYKNRVEKLNTISNIDNNKKIIKLVLENVDADPKEVMKKVLELVKKKTTLHNTFIEINDDKYKLKYTEVVPDDNILFTEHVKNITNCKYAYIGILKVSRYTKRCTFNETTFQAWQNIPMDF
ncbi:conserved Plasmodium protein, unknown function [Plasmodium ovale wallikeri]|uniref:Uncharacterized protein n=2 Tax=Plasmodium ovale TaxID=36330 RepID=A0A1A8ZV85_PLAOA|nr:conserved Plasmodium protein, unknown function [Plasmodium ovale wallikeri]SBT47746.1 conserved Plasmodium protein, unknown function [Plasmodium ovale wallikeri]SBT82341.1 conserved Plasmodium protein, unknown function [Plasmodium ovale]